MDLKYKMVPPSEGGGALPNCGTIHIDEINPTLDNLANDLELPFDLQSFLVGSTGKKTYSGDIDVVMDDRWWGHTLEDLRSNLIELYGEENVKRHADILHLRYPIAHYDSSKIGRLPRTGYVQIDFYFGNIEWERFYHYSPGNNSGYKGSHRNLSMSAVCAEVNTSKSTEVDTYNRPVYTVRWKWGPKGFFKVTRLSVRDKITGVWKKKQVDEVLEGPYIDPAFVSKILFPLDGSSTDLESLETIMLAVKRNYGLVDQERIWRKIAENVQGSSDWNYFEYPPEISAYLDIKDK